MSRRACSLEHVPLPDWYNPGRIERSLDAPYGGPRTYFIGWRDGPVKIGRAMDVRKRILEMQTGSPYRLFIWAVSTYPVHAEPKLHSRFESSRMIGEWFLRTPDLIAMMASLNGASRECLAAIRQESCGTECGKGEAALTFQVS